MGNAPKPIKVIEDTFCVTANDPVIFSSMISGHSRNGYEPVGSPTIFAKPHSDEGGWCDRFSLVMAKYRIEYH